MGQLSEMGRVNDWYELKHIWVPENFILGKFGQCRVASGMRKSWTIVDQDGFWLRGHDGVHEFVSVAFQVGFSDS